MKPLPLARLLLPALLLSTLPLHAEVKLSKVFTPHMVLQRGMPVPIWGTAAAGEKVEVKFRDQSKTATAGADGKWSVKLDALKVGGPDVLTIGGKKIEDVLVGDVWVGSGQSNMDMTTTSYTANDPGLAKIVAENYPKVRLLKKDAGAVWQEATPANNTGFSAMLFSFGIPLQKELDVPVGLMVGAVGGTPSGYWLSEEMYNADPACKAAIEKFAKTYNYEAEVEKYKVAKEKYDQDLAAWKKLADAAKAEGKPAPAGQPRPPQPALKAGEPRGKIGNLFESYIRPYVGYAIKGVLWDQGESGTAITGVDQYSLMGALIKGWRKDWGQGDFPFLYVQKPSGGGCAWDYNDPVTSQANKFSPLPAAVPPAPTGDYTHPVYLRLMNYPNTIMVTSTDLGPGTHPTNKSGYGIRGARTALAAVYGEKHEYYGPLYASHQIAGDKVTIKFTHTGKGLAFKNGDKLQGFAIAGADGKFVWGDAKIEGDTVIVSSKDVPKPAVVSYAWSATFPWANLFNQDGLPAQPFRTDVSGK
jgi:sialate O-acetylesterase